MALISNLKKVKKGRSEELFFSYSEKSCLVRLWNENVCIQFQEEKVFDENVCCLFSELWSKIKGCKYKDIIKIKKKGQEYEVEINNKSIGTIGCVQKECPWKIDCDEKPLLSITGKTKLVEIAKMADKQILSLDMYNVLQYLHCKEGNLYVNNLVSIERFSPVYLIEDKNSECGFKGNFSVKPVYFKNIELLSSKEVKVTEYLDRIIIFDTSNFLIIKKRPLLYDEKSAFSELKGDKFNVSWNLTPVEGKNLIKEGIASTDKSILFMAVFKEDGNVYANDKTIGNYDGDNSFNISLKECLDGLKADWYKNDEFVFFNLDKEKEGKIQKVFKGV